MAQLLQCDKAAFSRLGSTLASIRQRDDGTYPLGVALLELRTDPLITLHLAPLAKASQPLSHPRHLHGGVNRTHNSRLGQRAKVGQAKGRATVSLGLQFPKHYAASGIRHPVANQSVLDSIANLGVLTSMSNLARDARVATMFEQSRMWCRSFPSAAWATIHYRDWSSVSIEQRFMIEVFAGVAILCATAKQAGLASSIAVDKLRKKACRSTILQLDLCNKQHQSFLERWLQSSLLVWVRLAPVCGTALVTSGAFLVIRSSCEATRNLKG